MTVRRVLEDALARARAGKFQEALKLLDAALQEAQADHDDQSVGLLARNAAIVADQSGDLARAEEYYRFAVWVNDGDAQVHFGLADVLKREGKNEVASAHLGKCFDLAVTTGDANMLELLEAVGFKKPV